MGTTVSGDIGGATVSLRVPVGGDTFDTPRDMHYLAEDVIAAIRAKPVPVPAAGGGKNWYGAKPTQSGGTIGTGYSDLGLGTFTAPSTYDWVAVVKSYVNIQASGTNGTEKVRLRYGRSKAGAMDYTGYLDFYIPYDGEKITSHTYMFTGDRGAEVRFDVDRSSGWTANLGSHYWGVYFRELTPDVARTLKDMEDPSIPEPEPLKLWTPPFYREINAGVVTEKVSDLAFVNSRVTGIVGRTAAQEFGPAWASGEKTKLGDGTFATWNGTAFVAA